MLTTCFSIDCFAEYKQNILIFQEKAGWKVLVVVVAAALVVAVAVAVVPVVVALVAVVDNKNINVEEIP